MSCSPGVGIAELDFLTRLVVERVFAARLGWSLAGFMLGFAPLALPACFFIGFLNLELGGWRVSELVRREIFSSSTLSTDEMSELGWILVLTMWLSMIAVVWLMWLIVVRFAVVLVEPPMEQNFPLPEISVMFKAFLERVRRGVGVVGTIGRDIRSVAGKYWNVKTAVVLTNKFLGVLDRTEIR